MGTYIKKCFFINLKDYPNLEADLYINIVLLAVFLAVGVAMCLAEVRRGRMALAVKQLIRHEAIGESAAKTLTELGLQGIGSIRRALLSGSQLAKIVSRAGEQKYTYEEYIALTKEKKREAEKIDFETARFYISEQRLPRARHVYESYGVSVARIVGLCVFALLVYVCISLLMPEILSFVNDAFAK